MYFGGGERKKKRSTVKTVTIKGRKYKVVAAGRKAKRPRAPDLNGSGYMGMFSDSGRRNSGGFARGTLPDMYSMAVSPVNKKNAVAKDLYHAGKDIYRGSRGQPTESLGGWLAGKISKKVRERPRTAGGFSTTQIKTGRSKVGFLKPNKMELTELRSASYKERIRDRPY